MSAFFLQPRRVERAQLPRANQIYESIHFDVSSEHDDLWTIGDFVALGRLVKHQDGALELGGIWVHSSERHRGHARVIVERLVERIADRACWCLPFEKLDSFYRDFGFLPTDAGTAASIADKLQRCSKFSDPAVVRRRAGAA